MKRIKELTIGVGLCAVILVSVGTVIWTFRDIANAGSTGFSSITLDPGSDDTNSLLINNTAGTAQLTMTAAGAITFAGAQTFNGTLTLGDNGDTVAIDSSDWDISTTGAMTGIGAITTDGVFTQTLATANPFVLTSTLATASSAMEIYNNNDDITAQQYLLALDYDDDGDADADFLICRDNQKADTKFSVSQDGDMLTTGTFAVNGGTISSTVDIIIDSAGGDIDFDAADVQIDAAKKLSLNGATETDYVQSNTNVEIVAAADILLDPAGNDIDVDAADLQLDAGKKLSLNGSTETDYIYSSTNVEVGAAADIVLTPAGGQVDMNGADVGLDAGKTLSLAGIAALTQAGLVYQNDAIEVFVNAVNVTDFTATGITTGSNFSQTGATTLGTGTGAISLNGDTTIASGKNLAMSGASTVTTGTGAITLNGDTTQATGKILNSTDNGGITANGLEVIVSLLSSADAIYRDTDTFAAGVKTVTFATAFSATPQIIACAKAAEYIYTTASSSTAATFASSTAGSTSNFDYIAVGTR